MRNKIVLLLLLLFIVMNVIACSDSTTTTIEEEITEVNIISSSIYEIYYAYKERLKIVSTEEEAIEVSDFFVKNMNKEDILAAYLEPRFFDEYALLIGYVNSNFHDGEISVASISKFSNDITVHLTSEFNSADTYQNGFRPFLSYTLFVVKVEKDEILNCSFLDIEFESDTSDGQASVFEFVNHLGYFGEIPIENVYEFEGGSHNKKIIDVNSVSSFNSMIGEITDADDVDILNHSESFFETHSYIFATYVYSSAEPVVSVMGLERIGSELHIVVSSGVTDNIDALNGGSIRVKLIVIEVLKANVEDIDSFSYSNYNLFNGDSKSVINNNNIMNEYELVEFSVLHNGENISIPRPITCVGSIEYLNKVKQYAGVSFYSFLSDPLFNEEFFVDNQIVTIHVDHNSSDGDVGIYEIRNYGSYIEILTSSDNCESCGHDTDVLQSNFIVTFSKEQISSDAIFVQSVHYLGGE